MPTWNIAFEQVPLGSSSLAQGDDSIRDLKAATRERIAKEHVASYLTSGLPATDGWHNQGSAKVYFQASAPVFRPDGITSLTAEDNGRIWINSTSYISHTYNYAAGATNDLRWVPESGSGLDTAPGITLTNAQFEFKQVQDWATYQDAEAADPVDGTGGTADSTFTHSTTTPLIETGSGLFTKNAGTTRQGEGFATEFQIALGARNNIVQLQFPYVSSANMVTGDMGVFIYDITNARLIPTSVVDIPASNGIPNIFRTSFYPDLSSGSYRLIFHVRTATLLAYTLTVDDISILPEDPIQGAVISEWRVYTPTFTGFGTPTAVDFKFRQVGSNLEIIGKFTSAVTTAVEARLGFPSGHTSRSDVPTLEMVGRGGRNTGASTTYFSGLSILSEPSVAYLTMGAESALSSPLSKSLASSIISNGNLVSFFASIPCAQFSSSMTIVGMNEPFYLANSESVVNTNGVVGKTIQDMGGTAILANTAAMYYDMTLPRALMPDEVPVLEVKSKVDGNWWPVSQAIVPSLFASLQYYHIAYDSTSWYARGCSLAKVNSSQLRVYFFLNVEGSVSYTDGAAAATRTWANVIAAADGFTHWRVRIGKNDSAWAIPPTVFANYERTGSYTVPTATPIDWNTKLEDSHNAVTIGVDWKFTCPVTGVYNMTLYTVPVTAGATVSVYKNGTIVRGLVTTSSAGGHNTNCSVQMRLNVGDYAHFRMTAGGAYTNTHGITITRIGS